jgi:metalloendopeptidase OMA1, mitochondrial
MKNKYVTGLMMGGITVGMLACTSAAKTYEKGVLPKAYVPSGKQMATTKSLLSKEFSKNNIKLRQSGGDYARLKRVTKKMCKAAGLGNFCYPTYIADGGKQVNAMAVQNNTIVFYKQLVDNIPNDTLLAVPVAHEVAHILNKHGFDNVSKKRSTAVAVGSQILGALVAAKTGSNDAGGAIAKASQAAGLGAFVRPYDRSMELEADHDGMLLMAKAGYNPQAAVNFWDNSGKYLGTNRKGSFLDTHPDPGNRRQNLAESLHYAQKYYRK